MFHIFASVWNGNGSFGPRVVSALSRFGPGSFRPGSFRPGSIRPWVVSAQFGGSFRPIFFSTIRLVTEGQLNTFLASWWMVYFKQCILDHTGLCVILSKY